jgi:hypothetical protein
MTARRLAALAATALTVTLVTATPAQAAYPSPNSTYKGSYDVDGDDFEAVITVKVGADKKKVAKVTAKVTCPGRAKPVRITWKNMAIGSTGAWSQMKKKNGAFVAEIRGVFGSSSAVSGELNFFQNQCDPYQYFGWDALKK